MGVGNGVGVGAPAQDEINIKLPSCDGLKPVTSFITLNGDSALSSDTGNIPLKA